MDGYGQFCPIAKAAEVFDQRWTLLVLREMVAGSTRFNDIHRGVPRMSRSQLSKRLRELSAEGLVVRRECDEGPVYELTAAGQDLQPVMDVIGAWGMRWLDSLSDEDLDPAFLLWDVRRSINAGALPEGRTVLALTFCDLNPKLRDWWLLLSAAEIDVCDKDPGYGTDVALTIPIRTFVRVWRGDIGWSDALRTAPSRLDGPEHLRRQLPDWFKLSHFASVPR